MKTDHKQDRGGLRFLCGGKSRLKLVLLIVAILAAVALTVGYAKSKNRGSGDQYKVQEVAIGTVKKVVSATGTIQPWTVVDIKSKAGGRVNELNVELGDLVKKDQVIARIDPSDSQLSVSTAKADIDGAVARVLQNQASFQLQVSQSSIGISTARAQVDAARANLASMEARLRTAKDQAGSQPSLTQSAIQQAEANYRMAQEQRRLLDASQANERANCESSKDQAEANFYNADVNLKRQKALLDKGYVSKQSVDQQEAAFRVAKAQLTAAKERLRTLTDEQHANLQAQDARVSQALAQLQSAKSQTDVKDKTNSAKEAEAALRQARSQVTQAEENLKQAIANVKNNDIKRYDISSANATTARAKATYTNAAETLNQTTVRAPSDGVVLQKYVEQGTIITSGMSMNSTGTSIVQIGDVSRLYVNVTVDETDIGSVATGQKVNVGVDAYPGVQFDGTVTRISPRAEVEQNVTTVAVRVEITNTSPVFAKLKPNMNATCEFVVAARENVVNVPTEAVHSDDRGAYVQIAVGGKPVSPGLLSGVKLERRPIETGLEGADTVEVVSGLKEGEVIVTQVVSTAADAATTTSSPLGKQGGPMGPPPGGGPPPGMGGGGRGGK